MDLEHFDLRSIQMKRQNIHNLYVHLITRCALDAIHLAEASMLYCSEDMHYLYLGGVEKVKLCKRRVCGKNYVRLISHSECLFFKVKIIVTFHDLFHCEVHKTH